METTIISQNMYEHGVVHRRDSGERLEMCLVHLPDDKPVFQIAIFPDDATEPAAGLNLKLSLEEVQLQYALLHRLQEAGYLT